MDGLDKPDGHFSKVFYNPTSSPEAPTSDETVLIKASPDTNSRIFVCQGSVLLGIDLEATDGSRYG
ncbi:unnamed protein product [Dovyalis caffra]|uniref:Uncharacterized protein n=1 Tax=Dovyalis caffra TaxID=77055 RepID=A0AAV1S5S6_9ROSI|nr:unnamed protein product [Dovyalis caffra]